MFKVQSVRWLGIIDSTNWVFGKESASVHLPRSYSHPKLSSKCKREHLDRLLYPIIVLKFYLKMTSSYRQNRTRLFLPIKGNHDISKTSVSRWVAYTIKLAYRKLTQRDISFLKIKAYEVRALSSFCAFFVKGPLKDIKAVRNQSSTFAKFYLRDMSYDSIEIPEF